MPSSQSAVTRLWEGLQGTWQLARKLHSLNVAEPSGKCIGTATLTAREPSVLMGEEGKLETASKEMLYSEQGEFEMHSTPGTTNPLRFGFSRKYVWRLKEEQAQKPSISIWFVKPGTEIVDYLFHKVEIQLDLAENISKSSASVGTTVEGCGGHLCVDDFYTSTYTFNMINPEKSEAGEGFLKSWTMLHEVKGPKKDQIIETTFTRT